MFDGVAKERAIRAQQQMILQRSRPPSSEAEKQLAADYQALCHGKGIEPLPALRLYNAFGVPNGYAICPENTVVVTDAMLELMSTPARRASLLAHETAHLLLNNDLASESKEEEQRTDRLAIAILGDREPLKEMVRVMHQDSERRIAEVLDAAADEAGRETLRKMMAGDKKGEQRYGTLDERLKFIDSCDPNDSQLLAQALAGYKAQRQQGPRK